MGMRKGGGAPLLSLSASHADPDSGAGPHHAFLTQWKHSLAVSLCRRRAAMARAVLPQQGTGVAAFQSGAPDEDSETQCPLEEEYEGVDEGLGWWSDDD